MKILHVFTSPFEFQNGCWYNRTFIPALRLREEGHWVKYSWVGADNLEEMMKEAEIVTFMRYYPEKEETARKALMRAKELGKKVVYEIDDAFEDIHPFIPNQGAKKHDEDVRWMISNADMVTTTTDYLKDKLEEYNDNVAVCPNAINFDVYRKRENQGALKIGWSGGGSHLQDLMLVLPAIKELQKKYDFLFVLNGITSKPLEAEIYEYNKLLSLDAMPDKQTLMKKGLEVWDIFKELNSVHLPFFPPEMFPYKLRDMDLDIGLAPLENNEFNRSKSCMKFYEYAGVNTPTVASDVLPYSKEVNYTAQNTQKDWYDKIEALIKDEDKREEVAEEQRQWVKENRSIKKVSQIWEKNYKKLV